jgi:hypothetical protein
VTEAVGNADIGERDRARRRYAAHAGLIAAVLLVVGYVLAKQPGGTLGVVAFGYGLGVAVAAVFLALGWEPRRRK